jgi:carboxylesterase type B
LILELFFVWANEFPPILHQYSKRDRQMVDVFGTYWNNVAWFGNPNGNNSTGSYPQWPKFDGATRRNIVLDGMILYITPHFFIESMH